jgi:GT2 family glycosyltransferase
VGGAVLAAGSNYWALTYNLALFHEFLPSTLRGPRPYLPTLNLSVARAVIERAGVMDEQLARGQDIDWTARMRAAGFVPHFEPAATVRHEHNRTTLAAVWRDCARSGYFMRQVRLAAPERFAGALWLHNRLGLLLLAPLIAAAVTGRILLQHLGLFLRHGSTLPGLYLTKLAWCWGGSRRDPPR